MTTWGQGTILPAPKKIRHHSHAGHELPEMDVDADFSLVSAAVPSWRNYLTWTRGVLQALFTGACPPRQVLGSLAGPWPLPLLRPVSHTGSVASGRSVE